VRSGGPGSLGYQAQYPYGVEYSPPTANDREKYATYTRDSATGFDYAVNRYYSSQWGRFLSPDPSGASIAAGNPQSWNRYVYVTGDPVNHADLTGLFITAEGCILNPEACQAEDWFQPIDSLWGAGPDGLPCGFGYGTVCTVDPNEGCVDVGSGSGFLPMPTTPTPVPCPHPAPPPPQSKCFLELKYRGVPNTPGYNHAYLWVGDAFGFTVTIEGYPQRNALYNWGLLLAYNTPNGMPGTNARGNSEWGPELVSPGLNVPGAVTVPNLCSDINTIFGDETYYNAHPVQYDAFGGPNSNSLAHWLLDMGGVFMYFSAPPGTTGEGGWNNPVY
jgi:RHS repeat-associated protein